MTDKEIGKVGTDWITVKTIKLPEETVVSIVFNCGDEPNYEFLLPEDQATQLAHLLLEGARIC